jgi:hypothetical protein
MIGLDKESCDFQNEVDWNRPEKAEILAFSPRVLDGFEIARFWSRIEVRKRSLCWPWRWGSTPAGYGDFMTSTGEHCPAHRMAYQISKGAIEAGKVIRHTCDNPLCCNPEHLIQGTHQENVADRVSRGRSARGEDSGRAVLTENQVLLIRRSPLTNRYFAKKFEVDDKTVKDARTGKTWSHLPMPTI